MKFKLSSLLWVWGEEYSGTSNNSQDSFWSARSQSRLKKYSWVIQSNILLVSLLETKLLPSFSSHALLQKVLYTGTRQQNISCVGRTTEPSHSAENLHSPPCTKTFSVGLLCFPVSLSISEVTRHIICTTSNYTIKSNYDGILPKFPPTVDDFYLFSKQTWNMLGRF